MGLKDRCTILGPLQQLDTAPPIHGQFKQNLKPYSLTGLQTTAIIIHLYHQQRNLHKLGKGTVVFTDAASGMFDYKWHRDDTSIEGIWDVWAELITADGPLSSTNVEVLQITKRPSGHSKYVMGRMKVSDG